jgi:hypothetical protein
MMPSMRSLHPQAPHSTVADIQRRVGMISRTLFTVHMLSLEIPDNDSLASRVGALAELLAEELDQVWEALDDLVCAEPETPASAQEEPEARDAQAE